MSTTKLMLAGRLRSRFGYPLEDCVKLIDYLFDEIKEEVYMGNNVVLRGVGVFHLVKRKARSFRTPRTSGTVSVPPNVRIGFRCAKGLVKKTS